MEAIMNRAEAAKLIAKINDMFGNANYQPTAAETWAEMTPNITYEQMAAALVSHFSENPDFPPSLPRLITNAQRVAAEPLIAGVADADAAWQEVQENVRYPGSWGKPTFSNDLTKDIIRSMYTTWEQFCQQSPDQMGNSQARFKKAYQAQYDKAVNTAIATGKMPDLGLGHWVDAVRETDIPLSINGSYEAEFGWDEAAGKYRDE
jgi:hypothetical protein